MIKEKLQKLIDKDLNSDINKSLSFINENYDDNSLLFLFSHNGIQLNNNIILRYYDKIGFKCQDINRRINGVSPLCQNIERFLNRK